MKTKNILLNLLSIITIFVAYIYLQPMGNGLSSIDKSYYSLKTYNVGKDNRWSAFADEAKGRFFIHPGEKKASQGILTLKQDANIIFFFSIRKGSKEGDIEFTVKQNSKKIDTSIVSVKDSSQVSVYAAKGDKIEIIADKHGKIDYDWGNLQIKVQENNFVLKNYLIPFLWAVLFIFLFGKQHSYIALNSYIIFLLLLFAEKLNFGALNFNTVLTYMFLLFTLTFTFTLIYQELARLKKFRVAFIFSFSSALMIYIIPLLFIIYALNFDHKVTRETLYAVFQSNSGETFEYISDFISMKFILLFAGITAFVGMLLYMQEKKETLKIEKSLLIFIVITFLSITTMLFPQLRLFNFVNDGVATYKKELQLFRETQEKRKTRKIKFEASKKAQGETYVIIIGESLNKKHMGIYGYLRDTTPHLSKMNKAGELVVFNNTYSCATHTVDVLSLSLTEANLYNKKKYYNSLSIIEILKNADVETYWLSNQTIYGAWDNLVSVIGTSADYLISLNKKIGEQVDTDNYDGDLINEVKKVLRTKTDKNRVIFVHLMGSHAKYASRYPEDNFTIFNDKLKLGEFGVETAKNDIINAYDNSIIYNDYVVSSILKEVQKEKRVTSFWYMSDHADDAIRKLGHNASKFTFEMTQIPMIAWFSAEFKKKYTEKYNTILTHQDTLFSNDMLYDTLIGLLSVETDSYNFKYDLTSKKYDLKPEEALLSYGAKYYTDKSNYIYWQKANTQYLVDSNQSSRIFPHRVNSIGKLRDIWNDGFRSFEVDVLFKDNNTTFFMVGHDHGMTGIKLEDFIATVDHTNIERVWLDFKNFNKKNHAEALNRLEFLDKKYNIKEKFIIESDTTDDFFKEIRKEGWHTSYYMPTMKIVKLLEEKNVAAMKDLAIEIAEQIKIQNVSAVSFDQRLFPFVKKYLESMLDDVIVYHVWYAPAISSPAFQNKLKKNELYLDNRVKTLLTPYNSQFNL